MKRREFIRNASLASGSWMVPNIFKSSSFKGLQSSRSGKTLVVIQLSGGNDGLNTIIPFEDDLYYNARPRLAIAKNEVIRLGNKDLGFNPALEALNGLYQDGEMTIVNSVGYPNPNRSHFRSMDIWQTGSGSQQYLSTGWLGRYLDHECSDCEPYTALNLDDELHIALKGQESSGFAVGDLKKIRRTTENRYLKALANHHHDHDHENVEYLYKTLIDTQSSAQYLHDKSKVHHSKITYPKNKFGKDLKQIAELMTADADVKVYYASLGGFDTHAGQRGKQDRLLKTYAEAVSAFIKDLKQNGLFDDTLVMTFSEFGRRVQQNAGNGTDHGTANNMFLMGGKLRKKGLYNDAPNLADLDKGDLKYQLDFRQVYADVIDNWLQGDSELILGERFAKLGLV